MASYKIPKEDPDQKSSPRTLYRAPKYDKWRRDDLYHLAAQKGIKDRANMSDQELADALQQLHSGSA